jgi:hypothetical protein
MPQHREAQKPEKRQENEDDDREQKLNGKLSGCFLCLMALL